MSYRTKARGRPPRRNRTPRRPLPRRSRPKKARLANGRGEIHGRIFPDTYNGLRAHYKSRGNGSWPSTWVRQLPSSNRARDDQGYARTWPGLEPRSRGTPRRIRGQRTRSKQESPRGRHRALGSCRREPTSARPLLGIFEERLRATSRLLTTGARALTRISPLAARRRSPDSPKQGSTTFPTPPPPLCRRSVRAAQQKTAGTPIDLVHARLGGSTASTTP
jgi:hypothetical protein